MRWLYKQYVNYPGECIPRMSTEEVLTGKLHVECATMKDKTVHFSYQLQVVDMTAHACDTNKTWALVTCLNRVLTCVVRT